MTATTILTADELLKLPDDGRQFELVKGELRTMTPAGGRHGAVNALLGTMLGQHVISNRLGVLFTEATGFRLQSDPDTVRCPDIAFLRRKRVPVGGPESGFINGPPDLAVEVLSPDDTVFKIDEKVEEYLAAGTLVVWVVNPKLRRVTVHRPGEPPRILHDHDTLEGDDVLPGFARPVGEIFNWPE